ncbi:MAG: hypothetical protein AAF788_03485 [Pseudomonadota bacterium]
MKALALLAIVLGSALHFAVAGTDDRVAVIVRTQVWTHSYDMVTSIGGYTWTEYFLLADGSAALCAYDEAELADHPTIKEDPDCWAQWQEKDEVFVLTLADGEITTLEPAVIVEDRR